MVSDLKTSASKGCKIATQKKGLFFGEFCLTSRIFLVSVPLSASVERCFVSRMLIFTNSAPLGRVGHRVAMSVCMSVCLSVCLFAPSGAVFFEAPVVFLFSAA